MEKGREGISKEETKKRERGNDLKEALIYSITVSSYLLIKNFVLIEVTRSLSVFLILRHKQLMKNQHL